MARTKLQIWGRHLSRYRRQRPIDSDHPSPALGGLKEAGVGFIDDDGTNVSAIKGVINAAKNARARGADGNGFCDRQIEHSESCGSIRIAIVNQYSRLRALLHRKISPARFEFQREISSPLRNRGYAIAARHRQIRGGAGWRSAGEKVGVKARRNDCGTSGQREERSRSPFGGCFDAVAPRSRCILKSCAPARI